MLITIEKCKEMVQNKIFSVEFIKLDGTPRKMVCRLGVKKHLKGGSLGYDARSLNLLPVFDLQKNEYRMINFDSIINLTIDGVTYENTGRN